MNIQEIVAMLKDYDQCNDADIDLAAERLEKISHEWNSYKAFLQEKYPAENWEFTCEHHKRIDALVNDTY